MSSQTESGCVPCTNCCVAVPNDRLYAIERFGKFDKMVGPGFHCTGFDCCGTCVSFRSVTSRVEQNICHVRTKTKDNVFVNCTVAVQQSVLKDSAQDAMYKLTDVHAQIDSYVSDVVRSQVPKLTLDEAFEKKDDISNACQEQLTKNMTTYGFCIHKALVTALEPDADVAKSMNEINKQKRLRDATLMAAEAEKIKVVKQAEAHADAQALAGEGIARQRAAIIEGLRASVSSGDEPLTSARVTELLLITQYFETLKDIGATSKAHTVFVPGGAANMDIAAQIRNGVMQAAAAPAGATVM